MKMQIISVTMLTIIAAVIVRSNADCQEGPDCASSASLCDHYTVGQWMKDNCPVTCGTCAIQPVPGPECKELPQCTGSDLCDNVLVGPWMKENCQVTCGSCSHSQEHRTQGKTRKSSRS